MKAAAYPEIREILAARMKSASERPPMLWVQISTRARPHVKKRSG